MGKVTVVGGKVGMEAPVTYPTNFADATWAQVIEACQKKRVPATWLVGNRKAMIIDGKSYQIDIIGKNHDDYTDGSGKAPLTFQMHDCYATKYGMNSSDTSAGGWNSSQMRSTRLPALLALMPSEVKVGVRAVNKLSSASYNNSNIIVTSDKLFLLSEVEVFGANTLSYAGEGTQYDYYKAGNTRKKKVGSSAAMWWERSANKGADRLFCSVEESGVTNNANAAYNAGVSFAFCF